MQHNKAKYFSYLQSAVGMGDWDMVKRDVFKHSRNEWNFHKVRLKNVLNV